MCIDDEDNDTRCQHDLFDVKNVCVKNLKHRSINQSINTTFTRGNLSDCLLKFSSFVTFRFVCCFLCYLFICWLFFFSIESQSFFKHKSFFFRLFKFTYIFSKGTDSIKIRYTTLVIQSHHIYTISQRWCFYYRNQCFVCSLLSKLLCPTAHSHSLDLF